MKQTFVHPDRNLIGQLPKVDLHLHLDGCVKPETALELAQEQGITLPAGDPAALLPYMQVDEQCDSLKQYLERFELILPLLQTAEALERVAYETAEQSANHNCLYIEVRFAPQLHRGHGLSCSEAIHHVIRGLQRGEQQFGIRAQVIAICMRHHSVPDNMEVIEAAAPYLGHGLAAVDLAGDEASFPPERFRDVFKLAAKYGIPATIHAGEAAGPEAIREAIRGLGAVRIGHGVRLREDEALLHEVKALHLPLEMCPVSNIQTKAVSGWEDYPIADYVRQGLVITVNTDNPTVSGTNITAEYMELARRFNFTLSEIAGLILNGVHAAFLEPDEKQSLNKEFQRQFTALGIDDSGWAIKP